MTINIFQSGKGDALLLSANKTNILIDGGVTAAYDEFVSKALNGLHKKKVALDLACVSHIDDDHIGGFLKMIEDMVDWRVFDFQKKSGNNRVKAPKSFRPAEIKEIWHNAFHDVISKNAGEMEDMLAATANILSASTNPILVTEGQVAQSKAQAIQLSRRLKPEQLNIPLNKRFQGKLAMIRKGTTSNPIKVGSLSITLIAPFEQDLINLRKEWNDWLSDNKERVKKIKEKVEKDRPFLETSTFPTITAYEMMANELEPFLLSQLKPELDNAAKKLGVREKVTTPNLASIMFLVQEGNKTLLMTGDGHWQDIIKGLQSIKRLDTKKGLHLDALKVQHHGSEHNLHPDFCEVVTADHYIFCGNGLHENPDLDVIKTIVASRTTKPAKTPQANNKFTLWFNSSASATQGSVKHMQAVEKLVKSLAAKHSNVKFKFMPAGSAAMKLSI